MSLSTYYLECGSHLPRLHRRGRRRRGAYAPTSNTAGHENHEKISSWVSFCFPYEYGAPLGHPSGRRSSAIICYASIPVTTCHCRKALKKRNVKGSIVLKFVGVSSKYYRIFLESPRQSSEIFGNSSKMFGNFRLALRKFWKIFGNHQKTPSLLCVFFSIVKL